MISTPILDTMKFHRIILIASVLLSAFCAVSCKDDEEEEAPPYLNGLPQFDLPAYGKVGDTFHFTGAGAKDAEGNQASYFWYAVPVNNVRDTSLTYDLTLPDSLCTVTLTCVAFAKGYSSTTTSKDITVIKPGWNTGSITGMLFNYEKDFQFTDPRDGHVYWCSTIGDKDWFKENLAYKTPGCRPLENCDVVSELFGMIYNWEEASAACPEGWRVSTLKDWADAAASVTGKEFTTDGAMLSVAGEFMGDLYFNGEKMWEYWPEVKITNKSGLSMMPVGYATIPTQGSAQFSSLQSGYAAFWTADEKDSEMAYYRYIHEEHPDIFLGNADKMTFGASVRCVRDHE